MNRSTEKLFGGMMKRFFAMLLFCISVSASAFDGSDMENGKNYYLYNIYQSKFITANETLDNNNPALCSATSGSITVGSTSFTAVKNANGFYQLKSGNSFLAYTKGNNCGMVSTNNDRSYWMLVSEEEYAAFQAKKTFTVASLNVDGMPRSISLLGNEISLNPDAKEEAGANAIGEKLKTMGWDVVGVSEDFNYHDNILAKVNGVYAAMTHRGILSVGTANLTNYLSQSPLFNTDGLGLFYRIATNTPSDEKFVQWSAHNGYTDQGADGLIKKGYRYYLITLKDGTEIDLYILHMDAETNPEDNAARATQIRQLVTAIKASNNKRPIVVMGDTNCRYTRDDLKGLLIDAINADSRFTIRDPWIQYGQNNVYPMYGSGSIMADANGYLKGEVVDKVFYINNKESNIRLVAESYCQDLSFIGEDGEPLADHWPCVVTFSYHEYDPEIDDKPLPETSQEPVYLRNRATGKYLKGGGWWGAHAVVGNYGLPMSISLNNGKYDIQSSLGYIGKDSYMDAGAGEDRAIKDWTIYDVDGYSVLSYQDGGQKAITANDPFMFNDNPNHRYVTSAPLNKNDQFQQWKVISKSQIIKETMSSGEEGNLTFLMACPNFDRTDAGSSKWELTKASNQVTSGIEGLDNYENSNFSQRISTSKPSGWSSANNTWTLKQTIEGVPNGTYRVTFQGFYKEESQSGEHKVNVTIGGKTMPLRNVYEAGDGSSTSLYAGGEENKNGTYYPTTPQGVNIYFNEGLYQHEMTDIVVTDGTLTISIEKTDNTKSYTTLTHIDNFQLFYTHEHSYSAGIYSYDETGHWMPCSTELCEGKSEVVTHDIVDGICSTCGYEVPKHEHSYATEWSNDETNHWHAATCEHSDLKSDEAEHTWGSEDVENEGYYICSVCQYENDARKAEYDERQEELNHKHTFADAWSSDETFHWHEATCIHEEEVADKAEHEWGSEELESESYCICSVCMYEDAARKNAHDEYIREKEEKERQEANQKAYDDIIAEKKTLEGEVTNARTEIDNNTDYPELVAKYGEELNAIETEIAKIQSAIEEELKDNTLVGNALSYSNQLAALNKQIEDLLKRMKEEIEELEKETSITQINADMKADNATVYTIAGSRVRTVTRTGIYIVNGKKVMVK